MTVHMRWAPGTLAAFLLAAAPWSDRRSAAGAGALLLVLLVPAAAALAVTGWYGVENVYRYGLGVMRPPTPESGGHRHGGAMPGMDTQGKGHSGAAPAGSGHERGPHGALRDDATACAPPRCRRFVSDRAGPHSGARRRPA